jgi:uncharacterized protein YukE
VTDLGPIHEPVDFAWGPAKALSAQLRRAARTLDDAIPRLGAAAHHGRQDWHGAYARRFDDHMSTCTTDARRFVAALENAAETLDGLADLAREEQHRRDIARAWQAKHDEWEKHHHGFFGQGGGPSVARFRQAERCRGGRDRFRKRGSLKGLASSRIRET